MMLQPSLSELTIPEHFASIVSKYGDRNAYVEHHLRAIGMLVGHKRGDIEK